jgi:hypothetical protein
MRQWLSKAKPLSAILQGSRAALRDYCNITQPPDPDQSDVYLTYRDNADFERIGRELTPMLFSVSGGVSVEGVAAILLLPILCRMLSARALRAGLQEEGFAAMR